MVAFGCVGILERLLSVFHALLIQEVPRTVTLACSFVTFFSCSSCCPVRFRLTDRYLREPLQLPYGETVFLKWGSNVVSLKAKRSIRHRLSNLVGRRATVSDVHVDDSLSGVLARSCSKLVEYL